MPTPYRINIPYQSDRRRYGKSSPLVLTRDTKQIAALGGIDLKILSVEEIRGFMMDNQLGIDCSGFAYQMLSYLTKKIGKGSLRMNGFPKPSNTNVAIFASDKFSYPIDSVQEVQPGDLIVFNRGAGQRAHMLVVMEKFDSEIVYSHSTGTASITGVQSGKIQIIDPKGGLQSQEWGHDLKDGGSLKDYFDPKAGDSVRRLRILG